MFCLSASLVGSSNNNLLWKDRQRPGKQWCGLWKLNNNSHLVQVEVVSFGDYKVELWTADAHCRIFILYFIKVQIVFLKGHITACQVLVCLAKVNYCYCRWPVWQTGRTLLTKVSILGVIALWGNIVQLEVVSLGDYKVGLWTAYAHCRISTLILL